MMGVLGTEQQLCPCYKNCQQFHKLVELKDTGLVVYCHSTRRANVRQGADTESDVKDVFILHNTRGVKITTAGLTSELEKNDISCLRCRKTFEHAQELLQKVPSIGRRNTIGVCDHCRKRAQYIKKPCFTCKEIVEKFISVRDKQKEDTKRDVKSWLSRMGHLLKDTMNLDRTKKLETRTFSDAQINQLLLKPPKGRREPEVQQMFCPESHKSYTNIFVDKTTDVKEYNVPEKSVAFTKPIEPPKTTLDLRSLSVETGTTFVGTHVPEQKPPPKRTSLKERKQEDKSDHYDKYSMDAKEAIKKKHDLSLRQMVGKNFGATSKRPEIYEILKIAPWQHPKTELKDHDGISEIFIKLPKIKEDFSSESTSDSEDSESYKLIRYRSRTSQKEPKLKRSEYVVDPKLYVKEPYKAKHLPSRTSEKSSRDTRSEQYRRDKYDHGELKKDIFDSELIFQKIKRDEYQLHDKEFKSEQGLAKLNREKAIGSKDSAENLLKTQFSFFFPKKVKKLKKQFKVHSSELIRDTQEKIRLEKEQKHEKETKMLAVKEKKLQDEERQRQSVRDEKEYTVDMRITGERSKSLEEWERKPLTEVEKQGKIKRSLSKEDKYKTDRDRRDITLESEFKSKLSIDSGSVTKDSKQRTHPRDRMETGKMLKQKPEDEIEAVIEETKHKGKTDRELEKSKRDLKSKSERIDKFDDVTDKARKELSSKTDRQLEKSNKDLKSKSERIDTFDDVTDKARKELSSKTDRQLEKSKKDLKSKSDRSDTYVDTIDKAKKEDSSKTDKQLEKSKRDLKSKSAKSYTYDDTKDKAKKEGSPKTDRDVKSKSGRTDKFDDVTEKARKELSSKTDRQLEKSKRDLKSKSAKSDTYDDTKDKAKKEGSPKTDRDVKSKSGRTDKFDDVTEKARKELSSKTDRQLEKSKRDLKSKSAKSDTYDDTKDKAKKEGGSKTDRKDKYDEVSEIAEKVLKTKSGLKDRPEEVSRKEKETKKESKLKPEQKEISTPVLKKDHQMRSEPKEKGFEVAEKGKKVTDTDDEMLLAIKSKKKEKPKAKRDSGDKDIEIKLKRKPGQEVIKGDAAPEQLKKDLKARAEGGKSVESKRDRKEEEHKDKSEKEKKSKSETKGWDKQMEKDMAIALKNKEKEEHAEKLQRDKEEKERLKLVQQLRKEKEDQKKQLKKEGELQQKSMKDKETLKKSDKSPKVQKTTDLMPGKDTMGKESKDKGPKKEETSKVAPEPKEESKKKVKESAEEAEFRKLQAQLKKDKEEALKRKKMEEAEAQKLRDLAEKRAQEEAERKQKSLQSKAEPKSPESQLSEGFTPGRAKLDPRDFDPKLLKAHKHHFKCGHDSNLCILCFDSDLEIDHESYANKINRKNTEITDIIIGEYIFNYKLIREKTEETNVPLLFQSKFIEEFIEQPPGDLRIVSPKVDESENKTKPILAALLASKDTKGIEAEPAKGIIRYALSDRTFIDKGWTMLPTEKVVRKMNVYRMRPAHPEFDWFEHNKNKRLMTYDTGERLAEFDDNGRGRWYYRSGRLALDYYDAEETNAQQRFVIYSSGEPDERGRTHPITILATFDYLGNGIVFDHAGKIRLKYNQTEGVVLDRGIGPVSHWKWHTLNDPPVLQQVMIDTQMAHKDPEILKLGPAADSKVRPDNEEMLAIEFDNFIKEKSKKLSQKFKPFQIKMKALKINEHFSLKVLDQATIYLIFRDGTTNLKLNIGMILDHQEIVDTDTAEVGEVSNSLERFPARTDSLAGLQRSVAYAQRYERQRTERERRLRPPEPCASADHLTAAASPPLRPPLRTAPTRSTTSAGYCYCRKPSNNLYYNTRLL